MPDAIEATTEKPLTQDAEASNKSLADFLTTKVEGYKNVPDEEQGPTPEKAENEEIEKAPKDEPKVEEPKSDLLEEEQPKKEDEVLEEKKVEKEEKEAVKEEPKELKVGEPVPYDRFQEVARERTALKTQLEELSPMMNSYHGILDYCHKNGITPDQFQEVLSTQALINSNPQEALKKLLPLVEQLQGYVGNRLPEDLQKRVDDGKLEFEDAKEIAQLRAQRKFDEVRFKRSQEQQRNEQQQELNRQYVATAQQWEQAKRASDPDYRPKVRETDNDGLWEDVRKGFMAALNATTASGAPLHPVSTPAQMQQLMEQCYRAEKNKWVTSLTPKKPLTRKTINGSPSSPNTAKRIEEADSLAEAVQIHLSARSR